MVHLVFLLLFSLNSFSCADSISFLTCLSDNKIPKQELETILDTPQSKNYTSVLQQYLRNNRFNTSKNLKPTLILTPLKESQVSEIVICAKTTGVELRIRSGGHDFDGLSYTSQIPFVILDMFNLRSVDINIKDETAWVQSGASLGELYYRISEKSKLHAFPGGVCPTMGVGGHLSGGGYGNLQRKYGLSVDNVIDAKIVDANGRILDRKGMGEDLFWAIRGGGAASFGVLLSYKINLVHVPPVVTVFKVSKTLEQNAIDIIHRWQYVADKFDKELFVRAAVDSITGNDGNRTVEASFIALFLGDANNLVSLLTAQFPELGLKKEDCNETSWIKSILFWAGLPNSTLETDLLVRKPPSFGSVKIKSDYVTTPIPKDGLEGLFKAIATAKGNMAVKLNPYGGRMSEIPESAIAFPHRAGNIYMIQYLAFWNEKGTKAESKNIDDLRKLYNYMTPFVSKNPRKAFLNYRDIDIGSAGNGPSVDDDAKVYGIKYFNNNFDRLVQVKTEVDPTNFFRYEQSIPVLKK